MILNALAVLLAVTLIAVIVIVSTSPSRDPYADTAESMCMTFISKRLNAPGSADWSGPSETGFEKRADGSYLVWGWVDAQNSFGAKLRKSYRCEVAPVANSSAWRLLNLKLY